MSLLQLITLGFLVVVIFFAKSLTELNLTELYSYISHTRKIHEKNQSWGLEWSKVFPPPPLPPSLSSPLSAPLFKKRSLLLSNSQEKKTSGNPDLFDCSDFFIKRLMYLLLKAERNWEAILCFDD